MSDNHITTFLKSNRVTENYTDLMVCKDKLDISSNADYFISYHVTIHRNNYEFTLDIMTDSLHTEYYIYMFNILSNMEVIHCSFPMMFINEIDRYFSDTLIPRQDSLT